MARRPAQNYVNNRDILAEIHKSKLSYCYILDKCYSHCDLILTTVPGHPKIPVISNISDITDEMIDDAKANRAAALSRTEYNVQLNNWYDSDTVIASKKPKQLESRVDKSEIPTEDIVIRVQTFEHIPEEPNRKKTPKSVADVHTKCNFPPFKQYAYINDEWTEVVRSHWVEGFSNGHFECTQGKMTAKLAKMMIKLCERYSLRSNWRGYSYIDEMRAAALMQLSQVGLQFDESRGNNPFAYYTTIITNSFTRILLLEKREQRIKDGILQEAGYLPSFSSQLEDALAQQNARAESDAAERNLENRKKAGFNF